MTIILVATDGSEGGAAALKEAANKAATDGARLLVVTVAARDLATNTVGGDLTEYARAEHLAGGAAESGGALAEDILTEAKGLIGDRLGLDASYIARAGDPAQEILACAREGPANVLYMGSRGLSALGGLILGSVSREVKGAASCPVVIVPKRQ